MTTQGQSLSCQERELSMAGVNYNIALLSIGTDMMRALELLRTADGANKRSIGVLQDFHSIIRAIRNNYLVARFAECESYRVFETTAPVTFADDALQNPFVVQHLDAIIIAVAHNNISGFVKRNVAFS